MVDSKKKVRKQALDFTLKGTLLNISLFQAEHHFLKFVLLPEIEAADKD